MPKWLDAVLKFVGFAIIAKIEEQQKDPRTEPKSEGK